MELLTLIQILDTYLSREPISLKNDYTGVTWRKNTSFNVTYNTNNSLSDVRQICLVNRETIYVYFNYATRTNYKKIALTSLEDITIT